MIFKVFIHRLLFILILFVFAINISFAQQCQAVTKKGTQCKRKAQTGSIYCSQHRTMYESNSSKETSSTNSSSPKSTVKKQSQQSATDESYSGQCQAKTKKGTQCTRRAKSGSKYCWQHGG